MKHQFPIDSVHNCIGKMLGFFDYQFDPLD